MKILVSERAKEQLIRLGLNGQNYLRVKVVSGGCAGNTYSATIEDAMDRSERLVYQDGPLRVIADQASLLHLDGLEIDYSDDLIQGGFRLTNPKAVKTCGCGVSFQL
ncbi:MAG TPA: iron-sulfur cluster assembly accessory protein [Planctomycetaceae bacterium]|nr:iron-sulfur cluster assembly accessory protein [Planctomycetaceae bacterium]HIQ22445.1 iron-sulfur cluster assembly accessory protein [Planctomycetota bacterium]